MTAAVYLIGTALTWGALGALVTSSRDRAVARLGFLSSAGGALGGWALFGSVAAMASCSLLLSVAALTLALRPARRRVAAHPPLSARRRLAAPTPLPVRHTAPAVERYAS